MIMFCPRCGNERMEGANFCMKCGFDFRTLQSTNPAASSAPAPGPAASAAPVIAPVVPQKPVSATPWVQNTGVVNPNPVPGYETYNPTFHCRCEYCYFEFDYHTYDLGHRAWYPHGFVYCPRCQKPLRHKLEYEVLTNVQPAASAPQPAAPHVVPPAPQA